MNTTQHLLAVIEPTHEGDSSVDIARDVVARGGRVTVILMITSRVRDDIREFADAEGLAPFHAEAIAIDRLAETYGSRIGGTDTEMLIAHSIVDAEELLAGLAVDATSIAFSPSALGRQALDRITARAHIPVVLAPAPAQAA